MLQDREEGRPSGSGDAPARLKDHHCKDNIENCTIGTTSCRYLYTVLMNYD